VYVVSHNQYADILGQTVSFSRSGSKLASGLTLHIKAEHSNAQIQGAHAQTVTTPTPTFLFIPSQRELENGVSAGDLLLISLDVRGDRRQIESRSGWYGKGKQRRVDHAPSWHSEINARAAQV
jgi:hypothetical protein